MTKTFEQARASTNKFFTFFENMPIEMQYERSFRAHKDGIWEVACAPFDASIFGTASADQKAKVWSNDSSKPFAVYTGHTGSVNSIAFHAVEPCACTGSGDTTVHIWRVPPRPSPTALVPMGKKTSAREDHDSPDDGKVSERNERDWSREGAGRVVLSVTQSVNATNACARSGGYDVDLFRRRNV